MTQIKIQSKGLQLSWLEAKTKKRLPAGRAFFEADFGEYRLKIDERKTGTEDEPQYFCKPIGAVGTDYKYRVEMVLKKKGKFWRRQEVGDGYSNSSTGNEVYMDVGSSSKILVLTLDDESPMLVSQVA